MIKNEEKIVKMAFTKEQRDSIKAYIMEKIFFRDNDVIKKTIQSYNISSNSVYRYLRDLENEGQIKKIKRGKYILKCETKRFKYELNVKRLEEDVVYSTDIAPFINDLPKTVKDIWEYSFTEMFNNVLDHSEAKSAQVVISKNSLYTWINIYDNGIGIFKKIADYYKYFSLDEAIMSLFKGKLTTDSKNHSGEGIFFTSRIMDHFGALSSNRVFQHDNNSEELLNLEQIANFRNWKDKDGTFIIMALCNNTLKDLKEVFDMFSDVDGGFTITKIPMKNVCDSGRLISRSQAKRVYFGFDKFRKVILDFNGIEYIGQGFAHELFIVFKNSHPEIEFEIINVSDDVQKMINHAKTS